MRRLHRNRLGTEVDKIYKLCTQICGRGAWQAPRGCICRASSEQRLAAARFAHAEFVRSDQRDEMGAAAPCSPRGAGRKL